MTFETLLVDLGFDMRFGTIFVQCVLLFICTGHKNIKLVIMHGGLMGLYEAVDDGIPVIGLPLFFDQQRNIRNLERKGVAVRLEIDKITKNYLLENIRRVINDKRYKKQAEELSGIFRDRLVQPSKAVVYWTEYVIKYKGALHLNSGAKDLYWYQILNADIFFSFLAAALVGYYTLKKIYQVLEKWKRIMVPGSETNFSKKQAYKNGTTSKSTTHLKEN